MKIHFCIFLLVCHLLTNIASEPINKTFPDYFKFGVATAAYQVEGGWDADGKGENIWDHFLHLNPLATQGENGDIACDSYHKYLEDVEMLKNLGVNHYRFSLSWSRILPTGFINQINQPGVDYYNNLIDALLDNGIEPFVTLHHFDLPQPLENVGGWPNPALVDYFADYAKLAFTLFGDRVKNWMTFNEPKQTCHMGYGTGVFPPGKPSNGIGEYMCAHNIIKAHAKAYHVYDEEFRSTQNGRISFVVDSRWYEPATDSDEDKEVAERMMQFNYGWYGNPIYHPDGNYPQVMIDRIAERSEKEGFPQSRLPEFTAEEIEYIRGTYDFVSLNAYSANYVNSSGEQPIGDPSWEADVSGSTFDDPSWMGIAWQKIVPWGLRKLVNWIDQHYDHPEIIITENGFPDWTGDVDDPDRITILAECMSNVLLAVLEDNVNVTGYTVWTLMDNFEWLTAYTTKYGLYQVNFTDPNRTRTPKKSSEYYKKVVATKCLVDVCED